MKRRISLLVIMIALVLLIVPVLAVGAQDNNIGSILGVVYNDLNADGYCVGSGEPGQSGVPVEFVYTASGTAVPLLTGVDGSFGIVAITLGTWQVTVRPPLGWRVTSQPSKTVTLTETTPQAVGVDFCITQAPESGGGTNPPVLPESGADVAPSLLIAAAIGALLLAAGAGIILNSRRSTG
jgi:uncharacterized membrane-anchored protein YitT (DUF2179 family)